MAPPLLIFKYGEFAHPPGEVNLVNQEIRSLQNHRGQTWALTYVLYLSGELVYDPTYTATKSIDKWGVTKGDTISDNQLQFRFRVAELEYYYSFNYRDAVLYHSDGTTATPHALYSNHPDCLSGVHVDYVSFPRGAPDEYATGRTFYVRLSATFLKEDHPIQHLREVISTAGTGGPLWRWAKAWRPDGTAAHVYQFINPSSTQQVTQEGTMTMLRRYPLRSEIPGPVLPDYEHQEQRVITYGDPEFGGQYLYNFPLSWRYVMELPPDTSAGAPYTLGNVF